MIKKFLLMPIVSYVVYIIILLNRQEQTTIELLTRIANMTGFTYLDNTHWIAIFIILSTAILFGIKYINYPLAAFQTLILLLHVGCLDDVEITELSLTFKIVAADILIIGMLLASINQVPQKEISSDEVHPKEKED